MHMCNRVYTCSCESMSDGEHYGLFYTSWRQRVPKQPIQTHTWLPCLQGRVGPHLVDGFTTKHERNNPHDKYAVEVLPVDCHSEIVPPWRMN